jgi:quercetin dioxygenase-like cupin family protein
MSFFLKVAVLATVTFVHGLPQSQAEQSSAASVTASGIPSSSATASAFSATLTAVSSPAASADVHSKPTSPSPAPVPVTTDPSIAAALLDEPSQVDRFKKLLADGSGNLLTGDALRQKTVFDFSQQKAAPGAQGGSILLASIDSYPILTNLQITGAVAIFEPCGLNIPHSHPRADEMLTVVEGVLNTGMVLENGFTQEIKTQLGKYQGTVFPKGSIHYQQNPTCEPAVFVAGFGSNDPGRSDIATNFWMFDSDVIDASLGFPETIGGETIDQWRAHLPVNLALGVDSCLQACGIRKSNGTNSST